MKLLLTIVFLLFVSKFSYAGPVMVTSVDKIRVRPGVTSVKLKNCLKYNVIFLDSDYKKQCSQLRLLDERHKEKI
jgi:hypothetical protein